MGDADLPGVPPARVDAVTCSLVLHQCPLPVKKAILANAFRLLHPGGRLLLADYGPKLAS